MARIKHPRFQPGRTKALGIEFIDGYADVDLTDKPILAQALLQHGFEIELEAVQLESLTVRELRDVAEIEGIDLPSRATKAELIEVISRSPVPPAIGADGEPFGEQISEA